MEQQFLPMSAKQNTNRILTSSSCFVTLGKLSDFTEPPFSQLQNENDISVYLIVLLELNVSMCATLAQSTEWRSAKYMGS